MSRSSSLICSGTSEPLSVSATSWMGKYVGFGFPPPRLIFIFDSCQVFVVTKIKKNETMSLPCQVSSTMAQARESQRAASSLIRAKEMGCNHSSPFC